MCGGGTAPPTGATVAGRDMTAGPAGRVVTTLLCGAARRFRGSGRCEAAAGRWPQQADGGCPAAMAAGVAACVSAPDLLPAASTPVAPLVRRLPTLTGAQPVSASAASCRPPMDATPRRFAPSSRWRWQVSSSSRSSTPPSPYPARANATTPACSTRPSWASARSVEVSGFGQAVPDHPRQPVEQGLAAITKRSGPLRRHRHARALRRSAVPSDPP